MSWALGVDGNNREIGYGVRAPCDAYGCTHVIDRGLAFRCGDLGCETDETLPGCGNYFCGHHLYPDRRAEIGTGFCKLCLAAVGPDDDEEEEDEDDY